MSVARHARGVTGGHYLRLHKKRSSLERCVHHPARALEQAGVVGVQARQAIGTVAMPTNHVCRGQRRDEHEMNTTMS